MKTPLALFVALFAFAACESGAPRQAAVDLKADAIAGHECAACGMVVRDQPAPRGQLVHRDGTRAYFCSVADMLSYVDVPSPHGKPAAVFVEANDPNADPKHFDEAALPWIDAESASFVTGVENPFVMGFPILTYESKTSAATVAGKVDGKVHDWASIRAVNTKRQEK